MKLFYFINSLLCTTQRSLSTKTELGVLVFGKKQHPLLMLQHIGTTYRNDIGNRTPVVHLALGYISSRAALINLSGKKLSPPQCHKLNHGHTSLVPTTSENCSRVLFIKNLLKVLPVYMVPSKFGAK